MRKIGTKTGNGLCALLLAAAYVALPLKLGVVSGVSMEPTLRPGELFVLTRVPYAFHAPRREDLVVFDHAGAAYVKRVAAVAGDTVPLLHYPDDNTDTLLSASEAARLRSTRNRWLQRGTPPSWQLVTLRVP
ncbi:MAG TPA: signal peptidase I, partial [Armatimonadota bacterium]|nr:signal peptidase I [Armatimonadota bacterium]